jgi:perosamine synthetase
MPRWLTGCGCCAIKGCARLGERGIGSGVYYPKLVTDYDCYRDHPRVGEADTPVAAGITKQCLSLPVHAALTEPELATIVEAVRELLGA